jgi:hypothetical protein
MITPKHNALLCALVCAIVASGCYKTWTIPPPPPGLGLSLYSISPSNGPDSTSVTLKGFSFDPNAANDTVLFNGKPAVIVSASDSVLVAIVPTLAGTGTVTVKTAGSTATGGPFTYDTSYRLSVILDSLSGAFNLAKDAANNLYLPLYGPGILEKITPQGNTSTIVNIRELAAAFDKNGNLFIAATPGQYTQIEEVSPGGSTTLIATDTGAIWSMAIDTAGNFYATNTTTNTVDKITPQGNVSILASGLFAPSGIAVATDGTVYVTNYSGNTYTNSEGVVTKITPDGQTSTFANILYGGEAGITMDAKNNLYVTVLNQPLALGGVVKITPAGVITPLLSPNVEIPCGIVMDGSGNFFVMQEADYPGDPYGSLIKMTPH